ncbi:MAG: triose-phosphate isomerase [Deltaproteobacteria bacterium]|nr:triose-phosphate isomerase [Deltaproteobacteria bacterium]
MRRKLVAGNWKMHKTVAEAVALVNELKKELADVTDVDVVVAPVFTALAAVAKAIDGTPLGLAAQNCYPEVTGAFTGEVSPTLLKDVGCRYVIVGHSERRRIFQEADDFINRKVRAVTAEGLQAILCVGETLEERDAGKTFDILAAQIENSLRGISAATMERVIIAYEPVWAIGTGKTATACQAQEAHRFLRELLRKMHGVATAAAIRILYGGSVKADNAAALLSQEDIDGALVGGASLMAADFTPIVKQGRN